MQEGTFCLHALRLSEAAAGSISELAALLLDSLDPPPTPTATVSGREWLVEVAATVPRTSSAEVWRVAPFLCQPFALRVSSKSQGFGRKPHATCK